MSTSGSYLIIGGNEEDQLSAIKNLLLATSNQQLATLTPGNDPDVIFISSGQESIGIDQVRRLQEQISRRPVSRPNKVAIIRSAESLTLEAQNALLKTLEEPPVGAIIILLTPDEDLLLPTVLSRCRLIYLITRPADSPTSEMANVNKTPLDLPKLDLGQRFKLAAENSKSRSEATTWLDKLTIVAHQSLLRGLALQRPSRQPDFLRSIFKAKEQLTANCNIRLTMENLLLNW